MQYHSNPKSVPQPVMKLNQLKKLKLNGSMKTYKTCACFSSTYTKIGTIQRRLAWPLRKDDMQILEAFHIKKKKTQDLLELTPQIKLNQLKKLKLNSSMKTYKTF